MKLYFIVSGEEGIPSQELLKTLESVGEIVVIKHTGHISELTQLKEDLEPKVLALDPDSFDWDLDVDSLDNIPNVKAICTSSTSFDWFKPSMLKEKGIVGCNVPGFSADSVAEYALCMAIEVARRLPVMVKAGWKGDFKQSPMLLKGKTVGIIGLGRIGKRMAELCQGIGMNVIYWSKNSRDERFQYVELDELLSTADLIMPALIENEDTKTLLTNEKIDLMKATACFVGINRVRGIWDEAYVLEKVKKGEIGGYAFEGEGAKDPSSYEGNVWALPAIAWFTKDSLDNLMKIWVENVKAAAQGTPQNVVNK